MRKFLNHCNYMREFYYAFVFFLFLVPALSSAKGGTSKHASHQGCAPLTGVSFKETNGKVEGKVENISVKLDVEILSEIKVGSRKACLTDYGNMAYSADPKHSTVKKVKGKNWLFIEYGDAGGSQLSLYDADHCKEIWRISAPNIEVNNGQVIAEPSCDTPCGDKNICTCWPGQVFEMDSTCPPTLNVSHSAALNRKEIGIDFTSKSLIANPKSKNAKFVSKVQD